MMSYLQICGLEQSRKISIKPVTLCCSCCLIENVSLIDATNCDHYTSYKNLFDNTSVITAIQYGVDVAQYVIPDSSYVCIKCHAVLMKILKFKAMVNHSEYILKNRLNKLNKHNIFQFQITKLQNMDLKLPVDDFLIKTESIDIDHKTEPEDDTDPIDDAFQPANDHIDTADEIIDSKDATEAVKEPLEELKLVHLPDEWKGKIDYIHLTVDQIAQEKTEITNQPLFLDLEFKCDDCALGFGHRFSYADHMENKHVKKEDSTFCDLCKSFVRNHNVKRHLLGHYARWQCCDCGVMFKTKHAIFTHYNETHSKLEGCDFKCGVCNSVARTAYNHTMADEPDEPMDITDMPLPSRSNVLTEAQYAAASTSTMPFAEAPTIAAPKSKAQKQREYRQRIAASRTLAEAIAARKSDAERQRNCRLRKAANSVLVKKRHSRKKSRRIHVDFVQTI